MKVLKAKLGEGGTMEAGRKGGYARLGAERKTQVEKRSRISLEISSQEC